MIKHLTLDDGKDGEFNPMFPPPIHSTVDDFNFRRHKIGDFYKLGGAEWCDMPTSFWCQLSTSLRWQRIN